MKNFLFLLGLTFCCLATSAQPTAFGGVTPGKTTREELKNLVKEPQKVGAKDVVVLIEMKQPEGLSASFLLRNDVVYEGEVGLTFQPELRQALIEKYGVPGIKVGGIRTVTCRNKLGASFERLDGKEELRWRAKDGVQGAIERLAGDCSEYVFQSYILRHLATIAAIDAGQAVQARKDAEEARRKLGDAF